MFRDLPRPLVIAHRGASAHAPENTMAAFELAAQQGAHAIELDAQLTADNQLVVFHDIQLARSTDGDGALSSKTLAEVRELDAGKQYGPGFRGQRIPLLEEVCAALARRLFVNVHIKSYPGSRPGLVEHVCDLIVRQALHGRVFLSSFNPLDLQEAARRLPDIPRCLLAGRGWLGAWARSFGFFFGEYAALHPHASDVNAREVQRVHRMGRRVHAWTVNDPQGITRLADWGTDGVITDDPAMALRALDGAS
jgi:glycerophosphoryl diester phosphodiesterase